MLSSLFYGSYGVWTKLMGNAFDPFTQGVLRALVVVAVLSVIAWVRKEFGPINWRQNRKWIGLGLLCNGFVSASMYYATLKIGVGLSAALGYAGILLGMFLFGRLFSGERWNRSKIISSILAIIGLWLVFAPNLHLFGFMGMALAVFGGLCMALDLVTSQKIRYNSTQSTIFAWVTGLPVSIVLAVALHERLPSIHADIHWLALAIFALVGVVSSWAAIQGLKYIEAGAAGILGLLEIVFGVLFGVLFFHERPGIVTIIGMAAVLVAAAIPYFQHFRLKDEPFEL